MTPEDLSNPEPDGDGPYSPSERAGAYVLGVLSSVERAEFERDLASDPELATLVTFWERHLAPLALSAPDVAPSAGVWAALAARLGSGSAASTAPAASVVDLRRTLKRWRSIALAAGAVAAGLALFIAVDRAHLPTSSGETFVSVVNRGGDLPALIVRVDTRAGTIRVRPLSAEVPAGRSLQLWFVGAGQAPRSLGLLNGRDLISRELPSGTGILEGGAFAVSVEPPGGSPGPAPTGPVVYSGQLLREAP